MNRVLARSGCRIVSHRMRREYPVRQIARLKLPPPTWRGCQSGEAIGFWPGIRTGRKITDIVDSLTIASFVPS